MTLKYKVGEMLNERKANTGPPATEGHGERNKRVPFNAQDIFLNHLRREKIDVELQLLSGEKLNGRILGFDNFSIIIENTRQQLIYKHSVSVITPLLKKAPGEGGDAPQDQQEHDRERKVP